MPDRPDERPPVDPMRVVRLLWDPPPPATRGRRLGIALDDVVAAGVRVADEHGVDALSMRQVAAELGVGTMSLYTYVRAKAELVELMVDRVFGELEPAPADGPPRDRVAGLARASWALYHRHPWVLQTNLWRLSLGPRVLDRAEALYAALYAWGVPPAGVFSTARMVDAYVQGAARGSATDRETEQRTGESMDDYFGARQEFWERFFDPARYPVHTVVWEHGGFDALPDLFAFGLERLLDAIEIRLSTTPPRIDG